jgi:hypothetical protein
MAQISLRLTANGYERNGRWKKKHPAVAWSYVRVRKMHSLVEKLARCLSTSNDTTYVAVLPESCSANCSLAMGNNRTELLYFIGASFRRKQMVVFVGNADNQNTGWKC